MPHFADERLLLEQLLEEWPEHAQTDILNKLLSDQPAQQMGAWFQLMLFDWLRKADLGKVVAEPLIEGDNPDFVISNSEQQIYVEARARGEALETAILNESQYAINQALSSIQLPYVILVEIERMQGQVDEAHLRNATLQWLQTGAGEEFQYKDESGNLIVMEATLRSKTQSVAALISSPAIAITGGSLRKPLREKAKQHKRLRNARNQYVIALFLTDTWLSAEEVQEAWFGPTVGVIDSSSGMIIEERTDGTGLHYWGNDIRHKSVSGTLVFKAELDYFAKRRYLRAWYIENPYATSPVDPWLFPAESRFLIVGRSQTSFQMGWRSATSERE